MKGPPWAETMSGITLLIVTPGLELIFPLTPVPKLDRFEKKHVHDRIQRFKLTRVWFGRLESRQWMNCLPLHLLCY